jgi:hypothetical protein
MHNPFLILLFLILLLFVLLLIHNILHDSLD